MAADRRSSLPSSLCPPGTRSSATPLTRTPSWTASSTTLIVLSWPATACAAPAASRPRRLDQKPRRSKKLTRPTSAAPRAGSSRYRGAASSRNPWAQSSRFRRAASSESAVVGRDQTFGLEGSFESAVECLPVSLCELLGVVAWLSFLRDAREVPPPHGLI